MTRRKGETVAVCARRSETPHRNFVFGDLSHDLPGSPSDRINSDAPLLQELQATPVLKLFLPVRDLPIHGVKWELSPGSRNQLPLAVSTNQRPNCQLPNMRLPRALITFLIADLTWGWNHATEVGFRKALRSNDYTLVACEMSPKYSA